MHPQPENENKKFHKLCFDFSYGKLQELGRCFTPFNPNKSTIVHFSSVFLRKQYCRKLHSTVKMLRLQKSPADGKNALPAAISLLFAIISILFIHWHNYLYTIDLQHNDKNKDYGICTKSWLQVLNLETLSFVLPAKSTLGLIV